MPIPTEKPKAPPKNIGEANIAVLLTWLVPGGGHLYLGRTTFALVAFLVIEGLYLAGALLSNGMFLEYLPAEMRSPFAGALTPEVGNLGALLFHVKHYGYGLPVPRPWPATMDIGTTLTALSGILNLFVMSRAFFDARHSGGGGLVTRMGSAGVPHPATAALASFLLPGLGQFLQKRVARGATIFVLLVGLFFLGCWLGGGTNLDRERHFYYWAGQFLLGLPAIVAEFVHGHPVLQGDVEYADAGVVLACVAGMLNVLGMLDAYAYSEETLTGVPRHTHSQDGGAAGREPEVPPVASGAPAATESEVSA
jgi:TM2 domain-containing membrane protein YozV